MIECKVENPWRITSIYSLQYFDCPTCMFKDQSKQNFINHAYETHPEAIDDLRNISDGSLNDILCPWDLAEIKIEEQLPVKCEIKDEIEASDSEIYIPKIVVEEDDPDWDNGQDEKCTIDDRRNCEICNAELATIYHLIRHIETVHEDQKNYHCYECEKSFGYQKTFQKHMRRVHKSNSNVNQSNEERDKIYPCTKCEKTFAGKWLLKRHLNVIHESNGKLKKKRGPKGPRVPSKKLSKLERKIKDKETTVTCDKCGKDFRRSYIEQHVKWVHEGFKPFKCKLCDKAFIKESMVKRHVLLFHEKQKNYVCHLCGKAFSTDQHLQRHRESIHEGIINKVTCELCNKSFTRMGYLRKHKKIIHEGDRTFYK